MTDPIGVPEGSPDEIGGQAPTNDAAAILLTEEPYAVEITITGRKPLLFHRWSVEAVEAKANAAKGSTAKKTDDVESYVYRTNDGFLAVPAEYLQAAMVQAAKSKQDPRSPRKSLMDLAKAGFNWIEEYGSLGVRDWDYLDQRRVVVQRSAITRSRPAMHKGWSATFLFEVVLPDYFPPDLIQELAVNAGRFVGIGDFRPSYGRFHVTQFEVLKLDEVTAE